MLALAENRRSRGAASTPATGNRNLASLLRELEELFAIPTPATVSKATAC